MSRTTWVRVSVLGAFVLAAGAAGWWLTHPPEPEAGRYGIGSPRDVGETLWAPLLDPDVAGPRDVRITSIEPRVRRDSAAADYEYRICVVDEPQRLGFMIGADDAYVDRYCASTRPAVGSTLHLRANPREQLMIGITPTEPGRNVIADHRLGYRVGWQRGSMVIGVGSKVRATAG